MPGRLSDHVIWHQSSSMNHEIIWRHDAEARAHRLPAAWLVDTGACPANLTERSALRRRIGREISATQLGQRLDCVEISHDAVGRPLLVSTGDGQIHISLATRGGIVAVALAHHAVGIDVEQVEPGSHLPLGLLHPAEQAALAAVSNLEQALLFARIWTLKEAWLKALGTGFARELSSFAIAIGADGTVQIDDPDNQKQRPPLASTTCKEKGGRLFAAALIVLR